MTLWTVACQAPLTMEFSRQEYWSGWPFPTPGDLPNTGIKPKPPSPASAADSLARAPPGKLGLCSLFSHLTGPWTLPKMRAQLFARMDPAAEARGYISTLIMG